MYTDGARTTPSPSKHSSKCTTSVDAFPIFSMMPSVSFVVSMKAQDTLPVVFYGISIVFRPTKAFFNVRNKKNSGRIKSDDVVACRRQMTGAQYCIVPMEYRLTGIGWAELVHFDRIFANFTRNLVGKLLFDTHLVHAAVTVK